MLGLLGMAVLAVWGRSQPDTDLLITYGLVVLSFPIGYLSTWVVAGAVWLMQATLGIAIPGGLPGNIIYIVVFGIFGYAQWTAIAAWPGVKSRDAI